MFREKCIACESRRLQRIIDLGMHPLADRFIPKHRLSEKDTAYPLELALCAECHQIQTQCEISEDERYVEYDYSYTSSNSKTSRTHWEEFARDVRRYLLLDEGRVLEIGSNDGYLLKQFESYGLSVIGVDASPAMTLLAKEAGLTAITGVFGEFLHAEPEFYKANHEGFDLIVANNVFNHSNDPYGFAVGVREVLKVGGTFVFELPYWAISIKDKKFDQIYHEHVSYFTVDYAVKLFNSIQLSVYHVELVDYHGGSIRVFVGWDAPDETVQKFVDEENAAELFDVGTYRNFQEDIENTRNSFLAQLMTYKKFDSIIVCVGAAAKGNTFLNFYRLDSSIVGFITDASPTKQGKYTPLTRIPIYSDEHIKSIYDCYVIITSWNLAEMLKPILRELNPKVKFLNPYGDNDEIYED